MRDMWYPLTSQSTPEVRTAHRHQPQRRHLKSLVSLVKAYWLHNRLNSHVPFLQDANHHRETDLQWAAFGRSQTNVFVLNKQRQHHRLAESRRLQSRAHLDSNCFYFLKINFLLVYSCLTILLVSAVQQSESAIYIHISTIFRISFPVRSPQITE